MHRPPLPIPDIHPSFSVVRITTIFTRVLHPISTTITCVSPSPGIFLWNAYLFATISPDFYTCSYALFLTAPYNCLSKYHFSFLFVLFPLLFPPSSRRLCSPTLSSTNYRTGFLALHFLFDQKGADNSRASNPFSTKVAHRPPLSFRVPFPPGTGSCFPSDMTSFPAWTFLLTLVSLEVDFQSTPYPQTPTFERPRSPTLLNPSRSNTMYFFPLFSRYARPPVFRPMFLCPLRRTAEPAVCMFFIFFQRATY